MDINWLSWFTAQWRQRLESDRAPHAVMLTGPAGSGKRSAAAWLAASRVGRAELSDLPQYPPRRRNTRMFTGSRSWKTSRAS